MEISNDSCLRQAGGWREAGGALRVHTTLIVGSAKSDERNSPFLHNVQRCSQLACGQYHLQAVICEASLSISTSALTSSLHSRHGGSGFLGGGGLQPFGVFELALWCHLPLPTSCRGIALTPSSYPPPSAIR